MDLYQHPNDLNHDDDGNDDEDLDDNDDEEEKAMMIMEADDGEGSTPVWTIP